MADVDVREFKDLDLKGATLIVSVPNTGIGATLLTDHLLEAAAMDHAAAFDADGLPPVAMVHAGKARFPIRIHADPATRIAVLRSEIPVRAGLIRAMADAIVVWARKHGLARVVTLDGAWGDRSAGLPPVRFVTDRDETAKQAEGAGLERLDSAALAGLSARLLLEGRVQDFDVLGLYAIIDGPEDDLRGAVAFAKVLPAFVPGLKVDLDALKEDLKGIEDTVRDVQRQAEHAIGRLEAERTEPRPEQYI